MRFGRHMMDLERGNSAFRVVGGLEEMHGLFCVIKCFSLVQ